MGTQSNYTAEEGDALCLLEMTYFGVKSANQPQNNSKGPCEDAGGNRYKSIHIHSKTSPITTYPERPLSKEEATLQNRHKKARLRFATAHGDKDRTFWRNLFWSDETKIELFRHNDHSYSALNGPLELCDLLPHFRLQT